MAPELDTFINFYGLEFRNVAAVVANLTAVDPDGAGFVQVVPRAGSTITNRGATSNLNVQTAGQTVANAAILATGDEDGIGIYTSTRLQLIGDVSGYFRR
jgi:hypothetical protein